MFNNGTKKLLPNEVTSYLKQYSVLNCPCISLVNSIAYLLRALVASHHNLKVKLPSICEVSTLFRAFSLTTNIRIVEEPREEMGWCIGVYLAYGFEVGRTSYNFGRISYNFGRISYNFGRTSYNFGRMLKQYGPDDTALHYFLAWDKLFIGGSSGLLATNSLRGLLKMLGLILKPQKR